MRWRTGARCLALAGLTAALGLSTPARSAPRALPRCTPGPASTVAPTTPAGKGSPAACRAAGPVREAATPPPSFLTVGPRSATPSGYHHLGAGTVGTWGGVSGRFAVVDGTIRGGTYDFVAGRFMVKRDLGGGRISWLEAGWAETGWSDPTRQRVYTYNSNTSTWQFYDQYTLKPGDKVWLDLHTDANNVWQAWLWWNNRWNLLTAQRLAVGPSAYIEQYVEVYADASRPGRIDVPTVAVDNVQLRPAGGGVAQFWREDVPTLSTDPATQRLGGFCLNWATRYDTWDAGDCPPALSP